MSDKYEFDILPDQVSFDAFGRVLVSNPDFATALEGLSEAAAEATCNNGCGDTGCGNTANAGCSSSMSIDFDDWTIFDNELRINNADFAKAMLHAKIGGDLTIPMLIEKKQ